MTYKEFIQNIIDTRGQWNIPAGEYYENHHIVPKCMGGEPKRAYHTTIHNNLIWLTPKEHFIAHKLLAIENYTNEEIVRAYFLMCKCKEDRRKYDTKEDEYAEAKTLLSKLGMKEETKEKIRKAKVGKKIVSRTGQARKGKHYYTNGILGKMFYDYEVPDDTWTKTAKGPKPRPYIKKEFDRRKIPHTDESKIRTSQTMKNKNLHWYTNGTNEIRCKDCPEGYHLGRSDALIKNNSIKCKQRNIDFSGKNNSMYGKHHSESAKKKMSEWSSARHWYNNGKVEVFEISCPKGFVNGRLCKRKNK